MSTETTDPPSTRRLVLCFDGTANKFTGDETDTNIVKIYEMLDRKSPDQFHYYQPGIGTYVEGQMSNSSNGNIFTQLKNHVLESYDQALGSSFVNHVVAGYSFLMRFYEPGDKIYIFGFSRGAYTARFVAEMIYSIGLLSRGNEEMVRFAWSTFSDYQRTRGRDPKFKDFMLRFKETFCRERVVVHFLGLFDCVNSVAQFQIPLFGKSSPYIPVPPATHIRHAVSIHERRLMFKPALFLLDPSEPPKSDVKEVWFAGNHGDVGGGWHCQGANYLLSDIALRWMVDEVIALPDTENVLAWQKTKVDHMAQHETQLESVLALKRVLTNMKKPRKNLLHKLIHDTLSFGGGESFFSVLSWWILEVLPFAYYELVGGKWVRRYWPPNFGSRRDIPLGAEIHHSVLQMRRADILSDREMPRLGGEEPYDPLPKWSFFSIFKRKAKATEPHRDHPIQDGTSEGEEDEGADHNGSTQNGSAVNGSAVHAAHKWSFDHAIVSGAKTWDLV